MTLCFLNGMLAGLLASIPLQSGLYYGGGSRYIEIFQNQDRICYRGSSSNGVTVASVVPDSEHLNSYQIHGFGGVALSQSSPETLLFKAGNQSIPYSLHQSLSLDLNETVRECLNSQEPYYKQSLGVNRK